MKKQNVYTVKEALQKMMRYCTYRERCHLEVEQKLRTFHLDSLEQQEVIAKLISEGFLNEERFAKAFAYDKCYLQKWGRLRIERELKARQIADYLINKALLEIDEEDYYQHFCQLLQKRINQVSETNIFKRNKKIADFMLRKGYEPDWIYEHIRKIKD